MSAATQKPRPLFPPDERFWQRYSPHHELSLAGMTSFFMHGLVIGVMTLGAYWYLFQRDSETNKPPTMDMVQIAGGGDGFEGMGGEPGSSGDSMPRQTEVIPAPMTDVVEMSPATSLPLKDAKQIELDIPEVNSSENKADLERILANLEKEAVDQAKENTPTKKPAKIAARSTSNLKGTGGVGGTGGGPGRGHKGMGPGAGGLGGRKATKAEIYAWRWRFDLTGNGKEHATKLAAFGVTLAIPTPQGGFVFIHDLRRRPAILQPGNIEKYKDAVKWKNTEPGSLLELARELKLPFVPTMVIMLLPQDREEKMASEELRFAQKMGIAPQQIQATWFDFHLRDGVYEPVAIRQQ
jgi:hypothetical protein